MFSDGPDTKYAVVGYCLGPVRYGHAKGAAILFVCWNPELSKAVFDIFCACGAVAHPDFLRESHFIAYVGESPSPDLLSVLL